MQHNKKRITHGCTKDTGSSAKGGVVILAKPTGLFEGW